VTEKGISSLAKFSKLTTFEYKMDLPLYTGINEQVAILLFMHIPHAHIIYCEERFHTISYALFNYLENFQAQPMGQRAVRVVEISPLHDQLPQLLPQIETLYLENIFREINLDNVEPLLHFEQLSEVHFVQMNIFLCHRFFCSYGQQLVEVTLDLQNVRVDENGVQELSGALDMSLLFHHCPNLRKLNTTCKISQEMQFPLKQSSFDALWVANIYNLVERYTHPFYEYILKGKQLECFFTDAPDMLKIISELEDSCVQLRNLENVHISEYSVSPEDIEVAQNGLLKLLFLAPKLKTLVIMFQNFKTKQAFNPLMYLCEALPNLRSSFL